MLAQNFKTAAELAIENGEFDALVKVLGMLERGETSYAPLNENKTSGYCLLPPSDRTPTMFNMDTVFGEADCGTTACMLGWAQFLTQDYSLFPDMNMTPETRDLFLYQTFIRADDPAWKATPEQAARALRNYLTLGEPRWAEVLA